MSSVYFKGYKTYMQKKYEKFERRCYTRLICQLLQIKLVPRNIHSWIKKIENVIKLPEQKISLK